MTLQIRKGHLATYVVKILNDFVLPIIQNLMSFVTNRTLQDADPTTCLTLSSHTTPHPSPTTACKFVKLYDSGDSTFPILSNLYILIC